jgi:hypothetical protein
MKIATLKAFRSRRERFKSLSRDAWIMVNSDIDAEKLHALGVITFRWNLSENKLKQLFATLLYFLNSEETHALAHGLGNALTTSIKILATHRIENDTPLMAALTNALDVYEVCRRNRNQLTHFDLTIASDEEGSGRRLALARRGKTPQYRRSVPFPDSINDIRRVARDIRRLNYYFYRLDRHMRAKWKPYRAGLLEEWPLPKILHVPELLWKPPPQVAKER